jgi:LysR family glycine cleavage system transcriptional activator
MPLRSLPPLSALRAFAALAETRSMQAAGGLLNVSHAAISQQVRGLERHLGIKLITRDGRGVTLTAQGMELAGVVRDSFAAIAQTVDAMTGADAARPVQISTTPMFAASWLMPRIADFRHLHPDIDLMLNPTPDLAPLTPGGIDIGIRYGDGDWPGLDVRMLMPTQILIVAARKLIGDRKIDHPSQLLDYPWLQQLGTNESRDWLSRHGVTEGRIKGLTEVPGNLLHDGLRSGQGVVATIRAFIEQDIAQGDVVVLFQEDTPLTGYYLVTRPGPLRPAARTFAAWLRRQASTDAGPDRHQVR